MFLVLVLKRRITWGATNTTTNYCIGSNMVRRDRGETLPPKTYTYVGTGGIGFWGDIGEQRTKQCTDSNSRLLTKTMRSLWTWSHYQGGESDLNTFHNSSG